MRAASRQLQNEIAGADGPLRRLAGLLPSFQKESEVMDNLILLALMVRRIMISIKIRLTF